MTELKRLVLDYRKGELVIWTLYSTQDGPEHEGEGPPGDRAR